MAVYLMSSPRPMKAIVDFRQNPQRLDQLLQYKGNTKVPVQLEGPQY